MKIKILSIIIIISSFISGIIGSYIFLYYVSPELNNIVTKYIEKEKIVDGKVINITNLESEITNLIKNSGAGVVNIIIKKDIEVYRRDPWGFYQESMGSVEREVGGGSGFFITKDGIVMTNKHVVADTDAKYTVITNNGDEYDASVVALDPLTDLAIIKIDNPSNIEFNVLNLIEDETQINIGEFVVAIGNALGQFQNSVSFGVVSGKNRSIQASSEGGQFSEQLTGLLQTDAAINPGNSGGPLINLNGEIIGINTAISGNGQGLGFSIPLSSKRVDYILDSIKEYGEIKRPFIGINYLPINQAIATELGLEVNYGAYLADESSIIEGSSAQKAGLEVGDIILEIDGQKISLENSIQNIIQNRIPGDFINLKVLKKDGTQEEINIKLGEY